MVYDSITYHPTLTKLIQFLDTNSGREKLLRTLQYVARLVSFYFLRRGYSITTYQLTKRVQALLTLSRKPLRALKPLTHLRTLSKVVDDQLSDTYLRLFEGIRQAGYSLYFTFDSVQWLKLLGILKNKNGKIVTKVDQICYLFWFVALSGGILKDIRQWRISSLKKQALLKEVASDEGKDPLDEKVNLDKQKGALDAESVQLFKARRDLVKNILDSVIALNGLKWISVDEGVAGAAGVVTSVMGLQDLWRSTKI